MRYLLLCLLFSIQATLVEAGSAKLNAFPPACNMSGIYSIGTGGNFISLTAALDSLTTRGIAGNIIFELAANYNSSSEIYPITFPHETDIPCFNNNKITVRPSAAATNLVIHGMLRQPLLLVEFVNYLTIDGRPGGVGNTGQLSIHNECNSPDLQLIQASNNKFLYLDLSGGNDSLPMEAGFVNFNSNCNNNKLESCNLYSTSLNRYELIYGAGFTGNYNNNDSIVNCNLHDFYTNAVTLDITNSGWKILSNSFYATNQQQYDINASFIKIGADNFSDPDTAYKIWGNYFGGSQPHCQGNPMLINYQVSFLGINVNAGASIGNNHFARLNFTNTIPDGSYVDIRLINVNAGQYFYQYYISGNQFGSADPTDSIHIEQAFQYAITASAIYGADNAACTIINNGINHLHCYSSAGSIELNIIRTYYGSVRDNVIGSTSVFGSITNSGNSVTRCIYVNGAHILRNTISHIFTWSAGTSSSLVGILAAGGSVDSISFNRIFQLRVGMPDNSGGAGVAGINVYNNSINGTSNIISDNAIYALESISSGNTSGTTGIGISSQLTLQRNLIHSLKTTSNAIPTAYINGITNSDPLGTMENNMISLGYDSLGNNIQTAYTTIYGITGGNVLKHNSIYIGGTTAQGSSSLCYNFFFNNISTQFYNNIFCNTRTNPPGITGSSNRCVAISLASTQFDYNLYYYNGSGSSLGNWGSNYYNTLPQWKTGTGKDFHSIFSDPLFVGQVPGSGQVDLHLTAGSPADGSGDTFHTLANDFDQEVRINLTPVDIGADAGNYNNSIILCNDDDGTMVSDLAGSAYQWQINTGSGYTNLTNNIYYSGVNTNTLQFTGIPSSFYGYYYRCVVDGNNSLEKMLRIVAIWTGAINNLWSEPGNWGCSTIPDGNTDVYINNGNVLVDINGACRSLDIMPGVIFTVGTGFNLVITQ